MRTNLRCVLKGVGIAAVLFLSSQLLSVFLIHAPPAHNKLEARNKHSFKTEKQENKASNQGQGKCKGFDCNEDYDKNNLDFHPRNIGRLKLKKNVLGRNDNEQVHKVKDNQIDYAKTDNKKAKQTLDIAGKHNEILLEANRIIPDENIKPIRGVSSANARSYVQNANGEFTCLNSGVRIQFSRVNDDYCDCDDHTDEPGTSACSQYGTRFYCTFQGIKEGVIFSSRVNDGICDCCDGSDEFEFVDLPLLPNSDKIQRAPCQNTCQAVVLEAEQQSKMRAEGMEKKKEYIIAGEPVKTKKLYGENGVYYLLSTRCYYLSISKYNYKVCPFQDVTQSDARDVVIIGKQPKWLERDILVMADGSSINCPNPPRNTKIHFECGLKDAITRIEEPETCRYLVKFSTPAAC